MTDPHSLDQARSGDRPWDRRIAWALFLGLGYFPLFLNLDVLPLRQWDEARQAVSAFEMLHNGNWLVNHFHDAPDMWSTKPPLLVWCQALFMSLLGPGELAVRLPSAIASLLTGFLLMWACVRWLRKPWLGPIAALVLFTSEGYLYQHAARHGDYDAPMTFFMMLQAVALFRFSMNGSRRALILFFIGLAGAVLTKSVQGLLYLPGMALFLLATGSWKAFIRQRGTWIGLGAVVLVVGAFYLARERVNPGYIDAVVRNELGARYTTTLEGHAGEWDYYLERLIRWNFTSFHLLVPVGLVLGLTFRDALLRRWGILVTTLAVTYLLIISCSSTKCEWYDVPAYPMLAMLAAFALHTVFEWMVDHRWLDRMFRVNPVPFGFLFLVCAAPYYRVVAQVYQAKEQEQDVERYSACRYFKEVIAGRQRTGANAVVDGLDHDHSAHLGFYEAVVGRRNGAIRHIPEDSVRSGMRVLTYSGDVRERLGGRYSMVLLEQWYNVSVHELRDPVPAGETGR